MHVSLIALHAATATVYDDSFQALSKALMPKWALEYSDSLDLADETESLTTPHAPLTALRIDTVTYTTDADSFGIKAGQCTSAQQDRISTGVDEALTGIKKAGAFRDRVLWRKWFGDAPALEPDDHVEKRYTDATVKLGQKDWVNH